MRYDALRPQRLAAKATVYVEQFSAHPLESDASELYGPPDAYLDSQNVFHAERSGPEGPAPSIESSSRPMTASIRCRIWHGKPTARRGMMKAPIRVRRAREKRGKGFFPTARAVSKRSTGCRSTIPAVETSSLRKPMSRSIASCPPGGYTKAPAGERRASTSSRTSRITSRPRRRAKVSRARLTRSAAFSIAKNTTERSGPKAARSSKSRCTGSTCCSIRRCRSAGNAAQRMHGQISNDGPKNIVDAVDYIASRVWADEDGRDRAGVVLIAEQRVFAARTVMKLDARSGGYTATGGHGRHPRCRRLRGSAAAALCSSDPVTRTGRRSTGRAFRVKRPAYD